MKSIKILLSLLLVLFWRATLVTADSGIRGEVIHWKAPPGVTCTLDLMEGGNDCVDFVRRHLSFYKGTPLVKDALIVRRRRFTFIQLQI